MRKREPGSPGPQGLERELKANKLKTLACVNQAVVQHSQGSEDGLGPRRGFTPCENDSDPFVQVSVQLCSKTSPAHCLVRGIGWAPEP